MVFMCEKWVKFYSEDACLNEEMFSVSPEDFIRENSGRHIIYNPHLNDYDFYYVYYTVQSMSCIKHCFEKLIEAVVTQTSIIPRMGPCKCSSDDDMTFTVGNFVMQPMNGFQGTEEIRYGIYLPVRCGA